MKKFMRLLMAFAIIPLFLTSCSGNTPAPDIPKPERVETYSLAFMVDGVRYKTARVKVGNILDGDIPNPSKEGYSFLGWYLNDEKVDLKTFIPKGNTKLDAKFEKIELDNKLNVNDKKQDGKDYYLVIGWWECTKINDDGTPKLTSYLTEDLVSLFYSNVIEYVKKAGATDAEINNISFRNYSSVDVASMGTAINQDNDVDIVIGVGNNINSTAQVALYEESNDSKFQATMGTTPTSRYVALTKNAKDIAVNVFDWLKTDLGKSSFNNKLNPSDITVVPKRTNEINLTVNIHASTVVSILIDDLEDTLSFENITVPEGKEFKGFAKEENGEVVLNKALTDVLTYNDLKSLLNVGENTLDLYPIFKDIVVVAEDLVVYIQVNGTNLYIEEAELLAERFSFFNQDLDIRFEFVDGNAQTFTDSITAGGDADIVIGGNNPLSNYSAHQDAPLANVGLKHFLSTNRKVVVLSNTKHFEAAKKLYDFVVSEASNYNLHITFWENNHTWITESEVTSIENGINSFLKTKFHLDDADTLLDKFNLDVTFYEAAGTKVAALTTETKALRDGLGTNMIIACGNNVDDQDKMGDVVIAKKDLTSTFVSATGRKIALTSDSFLAKIIYDDYFAEVIA